MIPCLSRASRCVLGAVLPGSLSLVLFLSAAPVQAAENPDDAHLCLDPTSRVEREYGLEPGVLTAIGLTESGRRLADGAWRPWPWTINANGVGHYFDSRDEAIKAVQAYMLQGMTNIDIGCMQISLHWHNVNFQTLEEIFDPVTNLTYAAQYLAGLYAQHGSWERAVGHYHSADPERRATYLRKVLSYWQRGALADAAVVTGDEDSIIARAARAVADGKLNDALVLYRERLADNPDDRTARLGEAMVLDAQGEGEAAEMAWERLLVLVPGQPQAVFRLASAARALDPAASERRARDLLGLDPAAEAFAALLAERLAARGAVDDAIAVLRAVAARRPAAPLPWLNAGVILDHAGKPAQALAYYQAFLDRYRAAPVALTMPLDQVIARVRYLERAVRS